MAAVDVDVVESALRDVNLSSGREIVLKPEQESAVRALLAPFSLPPPPSPLPPPLFTPATQAIYKSTLADKRCADRCTTVSKGQ